MYTFHEMDQMFNYINIGLQFLASGLSKCAFHENRNAFHENRMLFTKTATLFMETAMLVTKTTMLFTKTAMLFTKTATFHEKRSMSFWVITKYRSFVIERPKIYNTSHHIIRKYTLTISALECTYTVEPMVKCLKLLINWFVQHKLHIQTDILWNIQCKVNMLRYG